MTDPDCPDEYFVPDQASAAEYRDRGSKFVARLVPVHDEEAALAIVDEERRTHAKCNHHCYAYRLGPGSDRWRANDDGEPSGTAGRPILGQIDRQGLSDVVIVVSRYFGGTKLGTSGLIRAYREAAALALETAGRRLQLLTDKLELRFDYAHMSAVMGTLSDLGLEIVDTDHNERAGVSIRVPRSRTPTLVEEITAALAHRSATVTFRTSSD